jgi:hypothetical protein
MSPRPLRIAAPIELLSLALLVANLATVHWPAVASLLGPIHGCAYLFVIGATVRETPDTPTRLLAIVPGIGGLLVIRRRGSADSPATTTPDHPGGPGRASSPQSSHVG